MRFAVTAPCCTPTARTTTRPSGRRKEFADAEGAVYISPYNHPDVIAGAGTDRPGDRRGDADCRRRGRFRSVAAGWPAAWVWPSRRPRPRPPSSASRSRPRRRSRSSLEAGRITEITPGPSLADGLVGNLEPGSMTFALVRQVVDYVVTVSEDDLTRAMKGLATEERLIVEGAGAAAVAAILAGKASAPGQRVVAHGHRRQRRSAEVAYTISLSATKVRGSGSSTRSFNVR